MRRIVALLLCFVWLWVPVQGAEDEKLLALTFDDGPSGKYTQMLLDGLEQRAVKATFLLCGYRMEQYPELTERIFEEGHEIGLHGYSHKSMQTMCRYDVAQEIKKAMALLPEGCPVRFLRAPGGACSQCIQNAAADFALSVLNWSVDPRDWAVHDPKKIEKEVLGNVRDGDVILMHDMSESSVEAALVIVDELREQGYRFVTVSELAEARNIALIPGKKYTCFQKADLEDIK